MVASSWFDIIVLVVVLANVVTMASETYGQSAQRTLLLERMNQAFSGLFALEAVLKVYSFGFVPYIRNRWNQFDFGLVVMSGVELGFGFLYSVKWLAIFRLQKMLRLLRVSRLFKIVKVLSWL